MTQFTAFVAVEEMVVTDGGQPRRIDVPVEVPEGVNRGAVFGEDREALRGLAVNGRAYQQVMLSPSMRVVTRSESGSAKTKRVGRGGGGNSNQASVLSANASPAPPPKPASAVFAANGVGESDVPRTLTPEEKKRADLQSKFHPSVLAVIDRLKDKKAAPGVDEVKFIRNGKAEIQIWLNDKSDQTMAALKALGFEIVLNPQTAKLVIGRMPIEKLATLAELKSVRYVGPQM
jgi:hypothetical protein